MDVYVGRDGMVRWTKEGFVVGLAMRARWTAEVCRLLEMRDASCGRREGKSEKGGLLSSRAVDSGDRAIGGACRNGGRRVRRSRIGCGGSEEG